MLEDNSLAPLNVAVERFTRAATPEERAALAQPLLDALPSAIPEDQQEAVIDTLLGCADRLLGFDQNPTVSEPIYRRCYTLVRNSTAINAVARARALRRITSIYRRTQRACDALEILYEAQELLGDRATHDEAHSIEWWLVEAVLASALHSAGFFVQAREKYHLIMAHTQKSPHSSDHHYEWIAPGNLALLDLQVGSYGSAATRARACLEALTRQGKTFASYSQLKWQISMILCEALVRLNRAEEAFTFVQTSLANETAEDLAGYSIHRQLARGLTEVAIGHHAQGFSILEATLEQAHTRGFIVHAVLRVVITAYEIASDDENALRHINTLTQIMTANAQHLATSMHFGLALGEGSLLRILGNRAASARVKTLIRIASGHPLPGLRRLAQTTSLVDDETGNHCGRVGRITFALCKELGFDDATSTQYADAAALHDIGKSGISYQILMKPARLTSTEMEVVKHHTNIGASILSLIDHPLARIAQVTAQSHHERWDGTGYPHGLAAEQIPEVARITSVADVFDVIRTQRCYKAALPLDATLEEIRRNSGTQFDPKVVAALFRLPRALLEDTDREIDNENSHR